MESKEALTILGADSIGKMIKREHDFNSDILCIARLFFGTFSRVVDVLDRSASGDNSAQEILARKIMPYGSARDKSFAMDVDPFMPEIINAVKTRLGFSIGNVGREKDLADYLNKRPRQGQLCS